MYTCVHLQRARFDWEEFGKGLDYFRESYSCPSCRNIEKPWCDVLKCEKIEETGSCLLCEEFIGCSRTEYQRERYPFVINHYKRVKKIGFEGHLKEEREKAEAGVLLNDIRKY